MDSSSVSSRFFERRFGLLQATALMLTMGGPQSMLGWGVALTVALADGLVWSELGQRCKGEH